MVVIFMAAPSSYRFQIPDPEFQAILVDSFQVLQVQINSLFDIYIGRFHGMMNLLRNAAYTGRYAGEKTTLRVALYKSRHVIRAGFQINSMVARTALSIPSAAS